MANVVVTGGRGFIGRHLVKLLYSKGHHVQVIDVPDDLTQAIDSDLKSDFIIHLAAIPRLGVSLKHPEAVIYNNVTSTLRILTFCRRNPTTKLINISSSSVKFADLNKNPYAYSKKICEDLIIMHRTLYQINATTVRLFNVYGDDETEWPGAITLLSACKNAVVNNGPVKINGDGSISRAFTHVDDVAEGLIEIMHRHEAWRELYEIGNKTYSVNDIINAFGVDAVYGPSRIGDPQETATDQLFRLNVDLKIDVLEYIAKWKNENGLPQKMNL